MEQAEVLQYIPEDMAGDDDTLMQQIATGDSRAFERLVHKHLGRAVRTAARILGSGSDAEDTAQEAFLRVWRHAPTWEASTQAGARFSTWFYRILINLCIDRKRKHTFDALEDGPDPVDGRDNAEISLERRQQSDRVRQAIASLPERQRMAFVLCFYEERSNKEAAQILDISVKALESLLVRARKSLHDKLLTEKMP